MPSLPYGLSVLAICLGAEVRLDSAGTTSRISLARRRDRSSSRARTAFARAVASRATAFVGMRSLGSAKSVLVVAPGERSGTETAPISRSILSGLTDSHICKLDPIVQRPRTPAFHAGNTGSNPVGVAYCFSSEIVAAGGLAPVLLATCWPEFPNTDAIAASIWSAFTVT